MFCSSLTTFLLLLLFFLLLFFSFSLKKERSYFEGFSLEVPTPSAPAGEPRTVTLAMMRFYCADEAPEDIQEEKGRWYLTQLSLEDALGNKDQAVNKMRKAEKRFNRCGISERDFVGYTDVENERVPHSEVGAPNYCCRGLVGDHIFMSIKNEGRNMHIPNRVWMWDVEALVELLKNASPRKRFFRIFVAEDSVLREVVEYLERFVKKDPLDQEKELSPISTALLEEAQAQARAEAEAEGTSSKKKRKRKKRKTAKKNAPRKKRARKKKTPESSLDGEFWKPPVSPLRNVSISELFQEVEPQEVEPSGEEEEEEEENVRVEMTRARKTAMFQRARYGQESSEEEEHSEEEEEEEEPEPPHKMTKLRDVYSVVECAECHDLFREDQVMDSQLISLKGEQMIHSCQSHRVPTILKPIVTRWHIVKLREEQAALMANIAALKQVQEDMEQEDEEDDEDDYVDPYAEPELFEAKMDEIHRAEVLQKEALLETHMSGTMQGTFSESILQDLNQEMCL